MDTMDCFPRYPNRYYSLTSRRHTQRYQLLLSQAISVATEPEALATAVTTTSATATATTRSKRKNENNKHNVSTSSDGRATTTNS
jgi:hypothetical protein